MLAFKTSKISGNMKARPTAPQLSPKFPPRLFLIVCYQQVSKDHFDRSLRRCGQLGSSFGCELLNGKQTICSQDGNDHLYCNDRHRGSYYWSQLHPALPPPQWGEIHKIQKYTNAQNHNILKVLFKNWDRKCLQYMFQRYSYQMVWA